MNAIPLTSGVTVPVKLEYGGQLVDGTIIRSLGFLRRVQMHTADGYFLAWVPKWKIIGRR